MCNIILQKVHKTNCRWKEGKKQRKAFNGLKMRKKSFSHEPQSGASVFNNLAGAVEKCDFIGRKINETNTAEVKFN